MSTYNACWPIKDDTATLRELIAEATPDLERMITDAGHDIAGDIRWTTTEAGGLSLLASVDVEPTPELTPRASLLGSAGGLMPAHKGYIRATPHGPDRPDDWREQAECKDDPIPDLWFVTPSDHHGIAAAKAICRRCPVAPECLAEAMADPHIVGVWGGLDEQQRARLHKERKAPRLAPRRSSTSFTPARTAPPAATAPPSAAQRSHPKSAPGSPRRSAPDCQVARLSCWPRTTAARRQPDDQIRPPRPADIPVGPRPHRVDQHAVRHPRGRRGDPPGHAQRLPL